MVLSSQYTNIDMTEAGLLEEFELIIGARTLSYWLNKFLRRIRQIRLPQ